MIWYEMLCYGMPWDLRKHALLTVFTDKSRLFGSEMSLPLVCNVRIYILFKCICFQIKTNKTKFKSCCLLCYGMILRMRIYESLCWCIRFQCYAIRIHFYAMGFHYYAMRFQSYGMRFHYYAMRFQWYTVLWGMLSKICLYWHLHKFCLLNGLLTKITLQSIKGAWLHNYCM